MKLETLKALDFAVVIFEYEEPTLDELECGNINSEVYWGAHSDEELQALIESKLSRTINVLNISR